MLGTPWTSFQPARVGSGRLAARGHDVLNILKRLNLSLPARNRLERAVALLDRTNDDDGSVHSMDDDEANTVLDALRTVFEAFMVTWTCTERDNAKRAIDPHRLTTFLEGGDGAAAESNSAARNAQFELVAATHLLMGGADLRAEEPDWGMLYHGRYVGIAVKRLTSINPTTLRSRLREGVDQIESAHRRGFIAVNLDNWITDLSGESIEEVGIQFESALRSAYEEVAKLAAKKDSLLGLIISATWLKWVRQNGRRTLSWRSPQQYIGFADGRGDRQRFDEFFPPLRMRWESSALGLFELIAAKTTT